MPIHPTAIVDARAELANDVEIGPYVVIEGPVRLGARTRVLAHATVVGDTTLGTLVANLGYDKVRMPKPVFIGDTLRAETEVVGLKDSNSRPDAGIVTFAHRMFNQRDELVCVMERTALMQRAPG